MSSIDVLTIDGMRPHYMCDLCFVYIDDDERFWYRLRMGGRLRRKRVLDFVGPFPSVDRCLSDAEDLRQIIY